MRGVLPDGSYLSMFADAPARVVDYTLADDQPDPYRTPAAEPASLYHERREIEWTYEDFKTHLMSRHPILRQDPSLGGTGNQGAGAGTRRRTALPARGGLRGRTGPGPSLAHPSRVRDAPADPEFQCVLPTETDAHLGHLVRDSILEERAESGRDQSEPRSVKQEMSRYPNRYRDPLSRAVHRRQPEIAAPDA